MANQKHLEVIMQAVAVWNAWREKNPEACPDLSRADLGDAGLSRADLSDANLSGASLVETNLSGADLHGPLIRG